MSKLLADRIPFAKILIVLASTFGIALGMCGFNFLIVTGHDRGNLFGILSVIEIITMVVSLAGIFLTLMVWLVVILIGSYSSNEDEPQKLFEDDNDKTDLK